MKKLFLVYLGGKVPGCHIEMHDVRFVVGEQIEDCYGALKSQWVGDKAHVHMDSYADIQHADGYQITVSSTPSNSDLKLYFVNLGAYVPSELAEQHAFALYVAKSAEEAKQKAKSALLTGMAKQHKDNLYDVDDCIALSLIDNHHIHLTPSGQYPVLTPSWYGYHIL